MKFLIRLDTIKMYVNLCFEIITILIRQNLKSFKPDNLFLLSVAVNQLNEMTATEESSRDKNFNNVRMLSIKII